MALSYKSGALASVSLLLGACATVASQPIVRAPAPALRVAPAPAPAPAPALAGGGGAQPAPRPARQATTMQDRSFEGIAYFLPRQLALVTAKRTPSKLAKAIEEATKAEGAVATAETEVSTQTAAVAAARAALVGSPDNDTSRRLLNEQLALAQADLAAAQRELTAKRTALATANGTVRTAAALAADPASETTLTIALQAPSADPARAYRLNLRHSELRDDEFKIAVNPAGLLTSTDIVAVDRTADVVVALANTAGLISGLRLTPGISGNDGEPEAMDCTHAPREFAGVVDLASRRDVARLNTDLQCLGVRLKLEQLSQEFLAAAPQPGQAGRINGIVYRTPAEVLVRIEKCTAPDGKCTETGGWATAEVHGFPLPQAGPISVLPQDASLFVRTAHKNAFDNGMLRSVDTSRPGSVVAGASLPGRAVGGFLDGVGSALGKLSIKSKSLAELSGANLALANARMAEALAPLSEQRSRAQAELALLQAQGALQTGGIAGQQAVTEAQITAAQALARLQAQGFSGQATVSAAELAALQVQLQLAAAGTGGQTAAYTALLAQLNQQLLLAQAQAGAPGQIANAQWLADLATLRDQARRDALTACIAAKTGAGLPIDSCLTTP